jgi:hypothetical protein
MQFIVKAIVERIGLNYSGQLARLRRDPVLREEQGVCVIHTPGGRQEAICIPLDFLSGFLFGISADRVKPEYREDVIRYQRECYRVLSEALQEGRLAGDATLENIFQTADPDAVQAYQIAQAVMNSAVFAPQISVHFDRSYMRATRCGRYIHPLLFLRQDRVAVDTPSSPFPDHAPQFKNRADSDVTDDVPDSHRDSPLTH